MKLTFFYLTVLLLSCSTSYAAEKDYSICAVAGFYEGSDNRFLTDLAERVAAKNNLFGEPQCTQALKEGKAVGERSKSGGERRVTDYEIIRAATHFSNLIYDSILSKVKLN